MNWPKIPNAAYWFLCITALFVVVSLTLGTFNIQIQPIDSDTMVWIVAAVALIASTAFNIITLKRSEEAYRRLKKDQRVPVLSIHINKMENAKGGELMLILQNHGPGVARNIRFDGISANSILCGDTKIRDGVLNVLQNTHFIRDGVAYLSQPNYLGTVIMRYNWTMGFSTPRTTIGTFRTGEVNLNPGEYEKLFDLRIKFVLRFDDTDGEPCEPHEVELNLAAYLP